MRQTTADLLFNGSPPPFERHAVTALQSVQRSFRTGVAASPIGAEFTESDAYNTQYHFLQQLQPIEAISGHKVALTTKASREHLGVHEPCYGHILSTCVYENNADVPIGNLASPHIEAEVAFVMGEDLQGPGVTPVDVMAATLGVLPSLELVDLKVQGKGISATDVIIHNALHGGLVVGSRLRSLEDLDLQYEGVTVEFNGELHGSGTGFEVMGNPINPVVWLVNKLAEFGDYLRAGETIISGSMVTPAELKPGDSVKVTYSRMGTVGARFVT
ncbi:2-oxo-hept-4-ene-1,7-dioate hydratase [Geodia barretti]|uniref:2-oxo-hept-4-ene-1,7-dioate hydratase n=1 Tax=Geodia barretti TaxID=519541 RepID=A0AA35TH41_GEOBA|nr:2-oxo-hept-4-ene-1,7-dioate hydratase [Geodia barretti]